MSGTTDIVVIYNEDADVWCRYIVDHLGKEHFHLCLKIIPDVQLVDWMMSAAVDIEFSTVSFGAQRLKEVACSKTFIVIASPGHMRVLHDNKSFNYGHLIDDPQRAQVRI